ncbi:PIR protein [Plasmodium vivax]|uniref:VIR protein n=1 Tax=Plasmodium vivax TaxID=5855 RepID=A0A565A3U0_PLAVI|nr:PIR protein [Plasmodium vivax]
MSNDIKDIAYWKEKYPFLNNMVTAYDEFNSAVIDDSSTIESHMRLLKLWEWDVENHKDVFKKISRNLSLFLKKDTKISKEDYCRFLYQWIYHTQKKYDINKYYISVFYQAVHDSIMSAGEIKSCPFYSYDKDYENSINIIKLQNFYNNIDTIAEVLMNKSLPQEKDSHYCYALRYANECVKIYRNMHERFCSGNKYSITKNQKTCSELGTFSSIYTNYLYNEGDINTKIPNLTSSENEKHFLCPSDELPTTEELKQGAGPALGMGTESGPGHSSVSVGVEQQNNAIKLNSTAVVGTMAGIPPFLALIYKFTPVGTLFRSKNKKSINAFNHLDEEIERELIYRRLENGTINSSPQKYNVAYGQV